ncbi:hypothetical protein JCM8097_002482 [Rhodosporidiobolus ruineniae]
MSFFTNPFAPSAPPILAPSSINPLPPSTSYPVPPSLRRSSLVRAATPGSDHTVSPAVSPGAGPFGSASSSGSSAASGGAGAQGGITFVSPFAQQNGKCGSIAHSTITVVPPRRGSTPGSPARRSNSQSRASVAGGDSPVLSSSRRASIQGTPSPLRSPAATTAGAPPFFTGFMAGGPTVGGAGPNPLLKANVDFSRRRTVDVGVLGVGTHRAHGVTAMSRRVRDAVGPDAGDKETGVIGAGAKGGKDRLLGRHLASLLAHSLSLCAEPKASEAEIDEAVETIEEQALLAHPHHLEAIPGSPATSPTPSRNTSVSAESVSYSNAGTIPPSFPNDAPAATPSLPLPPQANGPAFPVLSEAKRFKLIANLQSWSFNAMAYSPDELLACVGIIFESVRNMEGVEFDLDRFKTLLISLRSAYHARNGYHNFNHAADVTQACYSFLVRMGLAPPLYLLCEDDYDANLGEGRRKWRRNRAVEEGGMGELMRPMDVFALMVACIGHDVGHPGLTNAYMVNANAPVAQIYDNKSILENFHTVTLIHMLRKHQFEYLLGGDFGRRGAHATDFRKILEASILATDMSRHFAILTEITEMAKTLGKKKAAGKSAEQIEAERLLLCSGLIKCADISNPTRPHRISRVWASALLQEWAVQASIEADFGLPITVMTQDPNDVKAQAKGQVGFIDLFCKPLFAAMAGVVDEFADFVEKLRDGRAAWEAISMQTDEAFSQPLKKDWELAPAPPVRAKSSDSLSTPASAPTTPGKDTTPTPSTVSTPLIPPTSTLSSSAPSSKPVPVPSEPSRRSRPTPLRPVGHRTVHRRQGSNGSSASTNPSPLSPSFAGSASSATTGFSSFSSQLSSNVSLYSGPQTADSISLWSPRHRDDPLSAAASLLSTSAGDRERQTRTFCGGACTAATAMCEVCAAAQRRGSLGEALAGLEREMEEQEEEELELLEDEEVGDVWPPHPFQPTRLAV